MPARSTWPAVRPLFQTRGRVFGVIGMGLIGTATARKAAGLGYEVIGYDIAAAPGAESFHGFPSVGLDELLERAQVVSLHTPLTEVTRHLIGAAQLDAMRSDAILVNTSRGGVVDIDALVEALRTGSILGAAIDVHETEPLPPGHPLTTFDSVVLTPHLAWYTEESYDELKRRTIANVARRLRRAAHPATSSTPRSSAPPAATARAGWRHDPDDDDRGPLARGRHGRGHAGAGPRGARGLGAGEDRLRRGLRDGPVHPARQAPAGGRAR